MRQTPRRAALVLLGSLLAAGLAGDARAAKPKPPKLDANTNSEKMVRAGRVAGKILAVMESKKTIKIQVTMILPEITAGALNSYVQAQQAVAKANSYQELVSAQRQLAQAEANLVTYHRVTKDYELQATDEVKIRIPKPAEQFDDKGDVKKLTKKQLRELKGDPKLPGYPGEFTHLREGQIVSVTLVRKKGVPARPTRPVRPRGKKDKLEDVDLLSENLPQASMIVVIAEPK